MGDHEGDLENIMETAAELFAREKKKKLKEEEVVLKSLITTILPQIFQLSEACSRWSDKDRYPEMRKRLVWLEKKALYGDLLAIKEYNDMAHSWRHHEPGRFKPIKIKSA